MNQSSLSEWKQNFGKNLRCIRRARRHTQKQLAELLNVDVTTISKMENSVMYPGVRTLVEISMIYCISIDELLSTSK